MIVRGNTAVTNLTHDPKFDSLYPTTGVRWHKLEKFMAPVVGFKLSILESQVESLTTVLPLTIIAPDSLFKLNLFSKLF